MTKLEEVERKLELTRRHLASLKLTRDVLQEYADNEKVPTVKDFFTLCALEKTKVILEMEADINEVEIMLFNYKARLAASQQ